MTDNTSKARIESVDELLKINLSIPDYQRPYKWTRKNVSDLLDDIDTAISDRQLHGEKFKYRIGTVILHKGTDQHTIEEKYNIVDGQQRIITLSIIKFVLDPSFTGSIMNCKFNNKETIFHIQDNYNLIKDRFKSKNDEAINRIKYAFNNILETAVLEVVDLSEAFQLFDSQNTRGKELYPHDLLKAYHLREMKEYPFEKLRLIKDWEQINPKRIKNMFSTYMYPILNWARKENRKEFTAAEIEEYKGVSVNCKYTYGQRVSKAMPFFQINEPFCAGGDFFKMTSHYINALEDIQKEIEQNFKPITRILQDNKKCTKDNEEIYGSTGFRYAVDLFYCALLFYYDRFHSFNKLAVNKLFVWAMMLRVDMQNLGLDTINKYALGSDNNNYTNHIPMFYKISIARKDTDIADLDIIVNYEGSGGKRDTWRNLYKSLKNVLGEKNDG